jgi:NADH:ubiquinone oxidoreductase subunit E
MVAKEETKKAASLKRFMDEIKENGQAEANLIAILHKAQEIYGYLSKDTMEEIAVNMNIPTAHIWGVATFYHYFHLKPRGKNIISVCLGTACYVKGAEKVLETIKRELEIEKIGDTSKDKMFTLQEARCLGACGLAPVVMINDKIYGDLTPQKTVEILNSYKK